MIRSWISRETDVADMRNLWLLSLGALLVGFGAGWLVLSVVEISTSALAWVLIVIGGAIVASAFVSWSRHVSTAGIVSAFSVGLVAALLFFAGLPMISSAGPILRERPQFFSGEAAARAISFEVDDVNGRIRVSTWGEARYNVSVLVKARDWSESDAARTLDEVGVTLDKSVSLERLGLVLRFSVPSLTWGRLEIDVNVTLPAGAVASLNVATTNGGIFVGGVSGGALELDTVNGEIGLSGVSADVIRCSTVNGRIVGQLWASTMNASTVNGGIDLDIAGGHGGSYGFSATNGAIDIRAASSPDVGFRVDLGVTTGSVNVDVAGLTYEVNTARHKVAQTADFESRPVKIVIDATTVNGEVRLSSLAAGI
jgi:hypothetical protein